MGTPSPSADARADQELTVANRTRASVRSMKRSTGSIGVFNADLWLAGRVRMIFDGAHDLHFRLRRGFHPIDILLADALLFGWSMCL